MADDSRHEVQVLARDGLTWAELRDAISLIAPDDASVTYMDFVVKDYVTINYYPNENRLTVL